MNCPKCSSNNLSNAVHCRNCGTPLAARPADDNKSLFIAGAFGVIVIGIVLAAMAYFTGVVKCTQSSSEIATFEASAEWSRDRDSEKAYRDQEIRREEQGMERRALMWSKNLRCYRKTVSR